jgi:hypothetical protein
MRKITASVEKMRLPTIFLSFMARSLSYCLGIVLAMCHSQKRVDPPLWEIEVMTQQERQIDEEPSHKSLAIPKTDDPGTGAVPGMPNIDARSVTGVFESERLANRAARELRVAGFADNTIIVAAQPAGTAPELSASETYASNGLQIGATAGAIIGLVIGVLVALLGSDPNRTAEGIVLLILGAALIGGVLGGLIGSFTGLGKQTRRAEVIEEVTRAGGTTVTVATSNDQERDQASEILRREGAQAVSNYQEAL